MKLVRILTFLLALFLLAGPLFAADVKLQWDPSPSTAAVKYRVYRGVTAGGAFSPIADVPAPTVTYIDTPPADGIKNHLYYVTALDAAGAESARTNIAEESLAPPSNLRKIP